MGKSELQHQELVTAPQAAAWLAQCHPKRDAQAWAQWLTNNRKATRPATVRVPFAKVGNKIWYALNDLRRLADHETAIDQGFTSQGASLMASVEAGLLDQPWSGQGRFYGQYDEKTREPYVKLAIDQPLQTFRLSLKDAAGLFMQLDDAIRNAEYIAAERDPEYQPKLKPRT